MYVVVAGAGEVGYHLGRALRLEGHNVALIDKSGTAVERAQELDALVLQGTCASMDILEQASISKADLFVGATGDDEANMIACAMAKSLGVPTIARIHDEAYMDESVSTKYKKIGIDVAVCPELIAATKIANLLLAPALASSEIFVKGRVALVEARLLEDSPIVDKPIKTIAVPAGVNLVSIFRSDEIIIPRGDDRLQAGDRILMAAVSPEALKEATATLGLKGTETAGKVEKVIIGGATRIGVRLAQLLEEKVEVVLIEKDKELATAAYERLRRTLVITGEATDAALLEQEGVAGADAFVATSSREAFNIVSCLVARRFGVARTVAFITQPRLKAMVEDLGVNLAVTPNQTTVSSLLRFTYNLDAVDVSLIGGGQAHAMEVKLKDDSPLVGKTLRKAGFPKSSLVAALVRGDEVLIPRGDDVLNAKDKLVIFALADAVPRVEKLLRK